MYKTINIDADLHKQLKVFCAENDLLLTDFLHSAIKKGLGRFPLLEGSTPIVVPDAPEVEKAQEKAFKKKDSQLCEHYALKGLCKKGCK